MTDISGTITDTPLTDGDYEYDIVLTDTARAGTPVTATNTVGALWFAWIPGQNYLATEPLSVSAPAGWTATIFEENVQSGHDGYSIQFQANSSANYIAPGGVLGGFSFTSADTPSEVFGKSIYYPTTSVLLSAGYYGQIVPFTDTPVVLVACFVAGTHILTASGEVAVERLAVGDLLPVQFGHGLAPVRWLGHRVVDCRNHPAPASVWPIRVRAGAFGPGMPGRDLLLSPDHSVYVASHRCLVPVRYLVNGSSIRQVETDVVTYWHVELERHDVLLAEGLLAESYLDTGNRGAFVEGEGIAKWHEDFTGAASRENFARAVWHEQGCAPLVVDGPVLTAIRNDLEAAGLEKMEIAAS